MFLGGGDFKIQEGGLWPAADSRTPDDAFTKVNAVRAHGGLAQQAHSVTTNPHQHC